MTQAAFLKRFFADVYKGQAGEAVLFYSVDPLRVSSVRPVSKIPAVDTDKGLFFTVASYRRGAIQSNGKGRTKENLSACGVLHFDFDGPVSGGDTAFHFAHYGLPEPSYAFKRGDRTHVYYLLSKPCTDFAALEAVTKALAKKLGADALPAHPAALMRVPFTAHVKKGKTSPGYVPVLQGRKRYPLSLFSNPETGADLNRGNTKTVQSLSAGAPVSGFENILLKERKPLAPGEGRSAALYQFALRCRDFGAGEKEAHDLAEKFNGLYCTPPEPDKVVHHQVHSAYKYAKHPAGRYLTEKPERVALKFETDTKTAEALVDFIFIAEAELLVNTRTGLRYTKTTQIENALCYAAGTKTTLQYVLTFRLISQRDRVAFRPEEETEFETAGISYFNTFDEIREVEKTKILSKHVKVFEDHLRYLTTTPAEFEHLRKFLACAMLRPGHKIKHSLLLISTHEGIGKSVLQTLSEKILVNIRDVSYVVSTSNTEIARGNNSWIESKFLTFVHELGQSEKFAVLDQIKNWITEPRVRISDKYVRSYEIENHCNFVFFSNAVNALPISVTDRRFFIVINRKPPHPPVYYEKLLRAFDAGLYSIVRYLEKYADTLNINAAPPVTDSKLELRNYSKNELTIFLDECLADPALADFFAGGFSLRELAQRTQDSARASNIRFSQKQASMWLRENHFFLSRKSHSRTYFQEKPLTKGVKRQQVKR